MPTIPADIGEFDEGDRAFEVSDSRIRVSHDWDGEVELGTTITNAVALLTKQPPEAVGIDLSAAVDLDALDRLFRPRATGVPLTDGRLALTVDNCSVTVTSTGLVTVERRQSARSVD